MSRGRATEPGHQGRKGQKDTDRSGERCGLGWKPRGARERPQRTAAESSAGGVTQGEGEGSWQPSGGQNTRFPE